MGFMSWFRRRPVLPVAVWIDARSRREGLVGDVVADRDRGVGAIVVAHFEAALVQAGQDLAAAGVVFTTVPAGTAAMTQRLAGGGGGEVLLTLARALPESAAGPVVAAAARSRPWSVRLIELHVLAAANERVRAFAAALPGPAEVEAATAFDDPVMREFASPAVQRMMLALGLKPGEAIRSPMVSRAVARALAKLERRVGADRPAASLAEWLQQNLR